MMELFGKNIKLNEYRKKAVTKPKTSPISWAIGNMSCLTVQSDNGARNFTNDTTRY